MAFSWLKLIFFALLHSQEGLAKCMERDDHVHRYLTSSEPPFDNFYNISRAVYPSVHLPSLLIKITVKFLVAADNATLNGPSPTVNMSVARVNLRLNASHSRPLTTADYTWSMSCLYVSAGDISLSSMNVFSLWAIWPNRRGRELHLTLPQFCGGSPDDAPQKDTMMYFISTLQDIAVAPSIPDSRMNTAECVIAGHGKAPDFPGLKQLLHGVCWCFLAVSLVTSTLASQWLIVRLKEWTDAKKDSNSKDYPESKIAAVMFLCVTAFLGELILIIYACCKSPGQHDLYVGVFFLFVALVLLRRLLWCIYVHRCNPVHWNLTSGHDEPTSTNIYSYCVLYPTIFMACHHLLWILLGVITEPFWGVTVLVALFSVSAVFYFLAYEFHKAYPSPELSALGFWMTVILIPGGFFAFVLLMFVLLVVAQAFLSENLIATIVQNGLVLAVTVWVGYLKYDGKKEEKEEKDKKEEKEEKGKKSHGEERDALMLQSRSN